MIMKGGISMQPWLTHLQAYPRWLSHLILTDRDDERFMALSNQSYRVVVLDDDKRKYLEMIDGTLRLPPHESVFPVLLPPPDSINEFIEGNFEESNRLYEAYLYYNPEVQHCLNTIFTLLFRNINVLIYIPSDLAPVWDTINTLANYLFTRYGIMTSPSSMNLIPSIDVNTIEASKYATLIDLMYVNGTIPISEFCLQYPIVEVNGTVSKLAFSKLGYEELSAVINTVSPEQLPGFIANYIYGVKMNIINSINTGKKKLLNVVVNMEGIPNDNICGPDSTTNNNATQS